jgi:hypothetical protein
MPRTPKKKLATATPLSIPATVQEDYDSLFVEKAIFVQKVGGVGHLRAWVRPCRDDGAGGLECAPEDQIRTVEVAGITAAADANENTNEALFIEALEDLVEAIENPAP